MNLENETCPAELPNWCAQRHWSIFWLLILASVGMVAGRILSLDETSGRDGKPFFSANDRSRWTTVRALVDHGGFEIDPVLNQPDGRSWDTIDKVRSVGRDGQFHFYSSKPPALTLVVVAGYWLIKTGLGWEISTDTVPVVRTLLMSLNLTLWAVFLWLIARMVNSVPVRDWTRYYVLGCAGFATYLGIFSITLNNHLPAAVCVLTSLYLTAEIVRKPNAHHFYYLGAGLFAMAAVANELPTLVFWAVITLICLQRSMSKTLTALLPASFVMVGAILACNWFAWGQLTPAYGQRRDGALIATIKGNFDRSLEQGQLPVDVALAAKPKIQFVVPWVEAGKWPDTQDNTRRWVVRDLDPRSVSQLAILELETNFVPSNGALAERARSDTNEPEKIYELRDWGNWYDYPGSYWLTDFSRKSAIDLGESSVAVYAFHLLFGHHGVFSLTPLWVLSFAGMFALIGGVKLAGRFSMRWLGWLALSITLVTIAFYLTRPTMERNYGGVCCTARWLLWLVPVWLMTMLPVVDWLGGSRSGKVVCYLLMLYSIISASMHMGNPWTLPWLYQFWH